MKTKHLYIYGGLTFFLLPSFCSCSSEESLVQHISPKEEKAFVELTQQLKQANDEYSQAEGDARTRGFFKNLFKKVCIFFADAAGFAEHLSFTAAAETSARVNATLGNEVYLDESEFSSIEDQDNKEVVMYGNLDISSILRQGSLENLEKDSPGFIHNQILLNVYNANKDSLGNLSMEEFSNKIFEEGMKVTGEKISKEDQKKMQQKSISFAELAKKSPDNHAFVEGLKELINNPKLSYELDVLELTMQGEPLVDPYTGQENKAIKIIKNSKLPKQEKKKILDGVSILKGSTDLWIVK